MSKHRRREKSPKKKKKKKQTTAKICIYILISFIVHLVLHKTMSYIKTKKHPANGKLKEV